MPELVLRLTVRDLTPADLPSCAWSGGACHIAGVARALDRVASGEVDYLAVCPPSGLPVALGGVDYANGSIVRYETVCTLMRKELF